MILFILIITLVSCDNNQKEIEKNSLHYAIEENKCNFKINMIYESLTSCQLMHSDPPPKEYIFNIISDDTIKEHYVGELIDKLPKNIELREVNIWYKDIDSTRFYHSLQLNYFYNKNYEFILIFCFDQGNYLSMNTLSNNNIASTTNEKYEYHILNELLNKKYIYVLQLLRPLHNSILK